MYFYDKKVQLNFDHRCLSKNFSRHLFPRPTKNGTTKPETWRIESRRDIIMIIRTAFLDTTERCSKDSGKTSKVKSIAKVMNGYQWFNVFATLSILDVSWSPGHVLVMLLQIIDTLIQLFNATREVLKLNILALKRKANVYHKSFPDFSLD